MLNMVIAQMSEQFQVTVGEAEFFVGLQIKQDRDGSIFLFQEAYTKRILERFGMDKCTPVSTPADSYSKSLHAEGETRKDIPYRELIGAVMFLMVGTRPDIAYSVSALSEFLDKPQETHWIAAKRILRFLKGTSMTGIKFSGSSELVGYSDADFAGDELTRRSRTGLIFMLNNGPVCWRSQKQSIVSTSTCQAELGAAFSATKDAIWLRQLLEDIGKVSEKPVQLFIDNMGTVNYIRNPFANNQKNSKHWDVRYKYTKEVQSAKLIDAVHVGTEGQLADALTKPLSVKRFNSVVSQFMFSDTQARPRREGVLE